MPIERFQQKSSNIGDTRALVTKAQQETIRCGSGCIELNERNGFL